MTIADLKQYRSICAEIRDIESEIDGSYAGDTVQSGSRFPYSKHTVRIEGYVPDGGTVSALARLAELKHRKKEIEEFVDEISDKEIKLIILWRYIKRNKPLSWQAIAMRLGYQSEHTPDRKIKNFFKMAEKADFK